MLDRQKYVHFVDSVQSNWKHFFTVTAWLGTPDTMLSMKPRLEECKRLALIIEQIISEFTLDTENAL